MRGLLVAVAALGGLLAGGGPAPAVEDGNLQVLQAKVVFRSGGGAGPASPSGALHLEGDLTLGQNHVAFDPRSMPVELSLGPVVLSGEGGFGLRTRVRERGSGEWIAMTRRAWAGKGRLLFRMNPVSGTFVVKARGFPAGDLLAAGPAGVRVTLRLGQESWSGGFDFRESSPRRWDYRFTAPTKPPPGTGGGGGGGGGSPPPPPPASGFATVARGSQSGITAYSFRVITDQGTWNTVWAQHAGGTPPAVDFTQQMVVGVWLGTRPTGGHGVTITEATITQILGAPNTGPGVFVQAREDVPGANCITTQALTQPFHLIRMARAVDGSMIRLTQNTFHCP